jgi:GT2 family glycosyltransferase
MPQSSVVVVSYRPGPWLERCLRSVLDQADEVVVVDNGSADGLATATAKAMGARPVTLDRNTGFAAGVNAGVDAARGEVIALLNDDAFATPGWLARATAVLEDPTVAAVAPKLLVDTRYVEIRLDESAHFAPPDPRPLGRHVVELTVGGIDALEGAVGPGIHRLETGPPGPPRWRWTTGSGPIYLPLPAEFESKEVLCNGELVEPREVVDLVNNAGSYLSAEGYGGDFGYQTPDRGAFCEPADRFAASGAAMVMTADTFRRQGPFAAHFFAYYEDTDWCWRAQLAGLRIRYEPSAVVRHLGGATSGGPGQPFVRRLAARNRLATLVRNAPSVVVRRQLARARQDGSWPDLGRSLVKAFSRAAWDRWSLAGKRTVSPDEVWKRWAGRDEQWPVDGRMP